MISVLVVEDSPTVREFLTHILNTDPEVHVVGTARDGEEALEAVKQTRPHVITMDVHMPKMDGLAATRRIMETSPTPIVVVSGSSTIDETATTFRALEAGALAVVRRPKGLADPEHAEMAAELVRTVKLMSEVKVVRRRPSARWAPDAAKRAPAAPRLRQPAAEIMMVAIGASTGGPMVLRTILADLPRDFPVPILIVQHIAPGFIEGLAGWLRESSGFPVHVASDDEYLLSGHAYVAPDGRHMEVRSGGRVVLTADEPENGLRPSISHLFRSVARAFPAHAAGVLLTGMGRDGAEELKAMRDEGALTIVQDRESSIVPGMPGEAIRLDAATLVLPPAQIAPALVKAVLRK